MPHRKSVTSKRPESFVAIDLSQDFSVKKPLKNTMVFAKEVDTDSDFNTFIQSEGMLKGTVIKANDSSK